jgi:hypothetical protein
LGIITLAVTGGRMGYERFFFSSRGCTIHAVLLPIAPLDLMLSRLLTSAKSIFSSTSQTESQNSGGSTEISEEMVTTRQKGKIAVIDLDAEDTITVETPRSSRKRQRNSSGDGDGVPADNVVVGSASKKQKILPVRAKDDESPTTNTRVVVEIPVSKVAENLKENDTSSPKSAKESPKPQEIIEIEDSEASDEGLGGGDALGSSDESEAPREEQATPKSKPMSKAAAQAIALGTPKQKQAVIPPSSATIPRATPKHKRFGSEEPEVEIFSTAVERIEPEEESSDDDEAPEVVETQAAQKSIELKTREAARAIEEYVPSDLT